MKNCINGLKNDSLKRQKMISKELFEEVMGKSISNMNIVGNNVMYSGFPREFHQKVINIYELMAKCQDWAFHKGYNVYSLGKWRDSNRKAYLSYSATFKTHNEPLDYAMDKSYNDKFHADTEPEAVFMACEFILGS